MIPVSLGPIPPWDWRPHTERQLLIQRAFELVFDIPRLAVALSDIHNTYGLYAMQAGDKDVLSDALARALSSHRGDIRPEHHEDIFRTIRPWIEEHEQSVYMSCFDGIDAEGLISGLAFTELAIARIYLEYARRTCFFNMADVALQLVKRYMYYVTYGSCKEFVKTVRLYYMDEFYDLHMYYFNRFGMSAYSWGRRHGSPELLARPITSYAVPVLQKVNEHWPSELEMMFALDRMMERMGMDGTVLATAISEAEMAIGGTVL